MGVFFNFLDFKLQVFDGGHNVCLVNISGFNLLGLVTLYTLSA